MIGRQGSGLPSRLSLAEHNEKTQFQEHFDKNDANLQRQQKILTPE